jgi:indole-3-glycerol phosphate synthase
VIGVNNRNLKDFSVDIELSKRLKHNVPEGIIFVSESGVKGPEDMKLVKMTGADAVLIGEALMRADDKKKMLSDLKVKYDEN